MITNIERTTNIPKSVIFDAFVNIENQHEWWAFNCDIKDLKFEVKNMGRWELNLIPNRRLFGTIYSVSNTGKIIFTLNGFNSEKHPNGLETLHTMTISNHEGGVKLCLTIKVISLPIDLKIMLEEIVKGWEKSFDKLLSVLEI